VLTAIVLTLNEEEHLPNCLTSLNWVDELVVFDSFSTDKTCKIAERFGARVIQHKFENYAVQRNAALAAVNSEWIFFIDADERATPELAEEIRHVIDKGVSAGWWVPRHNYIFGRLTLAAGWFPDYQLRLLKRMGAHYDPSRHVHELVQVQGEEAQLANPLIHINYTTIAEFIEKQYRYTKFDAGILYKEGLQPRPQNFILQPIRQFFWRYVHLGGWREGVHGLRLSAMMGYFQIVLYQEIRRLRSTEELPGP